MRYDADGSPHYERSDRVWCWYDSSGPPVKGIALHKCLPRPHHEECYGVFLDQTCPRTGERLVTRAGWLLWWVFAPKMVEDYPLDALAEVARAPGA